MGKTSSHLSLEDTISHDSNSLVNDHSSDIIIKSTDTIYSLEVLEDLSHVSPSSLNEEWFKTIFFKQNNEVITEQNYIINTSIDSILEYVQLSKDIFSDTEYSWIYATDYYAEDSTNYHTYTDAIIGRTNCPWNPIITKVKYINYDKSSTKPKYAWEHLFNIVLQDELSKYNTYNSNVFSIDSLPIIFRKSWSFEYNNKLVEIITANNIVAKPFNEITQYNSTNECSIIPILPTKDINIAYKITVILIDNTVVTTDIHTYNIPKTEFTFPVEGNTFIDEYATYQYDDEGNIMLYPLFVSNDYDIKKYKYYNNYMFLDIDGDLAGELLIHHNASSSWINDISSYKFNGNMLNLYTLSLEDSYKNK